METLKKCVICGGKAVIVKSTARERMSPGQKAAEEKALNDSLAAALNAKSEGARIRALKNALTADEKNAGEGILYQAHCLACGNVVNPAKTAADAMKIWNSQEKTVLKRFEFS